MLINNIQATNLIKIDINSLYEISENVKVSPSFVLLYNFYIDNKEIQIHNDFENNKVQYMNNKRKLCYKKKYNPKIVSLYNNGKLVIDKKETNLSNYYIIFNTDKKNYHLINIDTGIDNYDYNKTIKFIDTTAFINLINSDNIVILENKIQIDKNTLNVFIDNWDGKLHNKTCNTEAIVNKNILKEE